MIYEGTHGENRSFKCDQCEKVFTRKDNLTQHMIIHSVRPTNNDDNMDM